MRFVPFIVVSAIALLPALRLFGIVFTQVPRWYAHGIVVSYVVVTPLVVGATSSGRNESADQRGRRSSAASRTSSTCSRGDSSLRRALASASAARAFRHDA